MSGIINGRKMKRTNHWLSLLGLIAMTAFAQGAWAAACNSAATVNNWSAIGTWSCGHVPAAGDDVVIVLGSTTTQDVTTTALNSLTVTGTLTINAAAGLTMTVTGGIAVTGTFSVGATAVTHTLNAGGNITNTGTINFRPAANRLCNVIFNKNGNQTVSGAGAYTFNLITLNMGATNANILDMQSAMTTTAGFLTITNGTYKHDNASNITPWSADPAIPASGGFWLASAATVSTGAFNVTVNGGLFRIDSGAINVGTGSLNMLNLGNFATTSLVVNGGTLTAVGGINSLPSTAPNTNGSTGAGSYTQTAGTVLVSTCGCITGTNESFMLGSNTTFTMSGGTIIVRDGNASTHDDANIQSSTVNVTGGTLQFGDASSVSGNGFLLVNSTGASVTAWNFATSNSNGPSVSLGTTLNVLNNLTIGTGSTLTAVDMIGGAIENVFVGNQWTNNSTFTFSTGTVTFNGSGASSVIAGTAATTFYNLTVNMPSNNLTINTTPTVNNILTFTKGNIVTGANKVIVAAAGTIATPSASSYVVGNFQKMYAAGNLSYFAGNNFPVGDATHYTPVNISAGTTTTAGSLMVSTTATEHPLVTAPIASTGIDANYDIARYWTFTTSTLTVGTAITATFTFVAGDVDAGANTANFIVERYDGAVWNITTLVAANPLNTQATFTPSTLPATGSNAFAIGDPLPGYFGVVGKFNACEVTAPRCTPTAAPAVAYAHLYTKLANTAFALDLVAVQASGLLDPTFVKTVAVNLLVNTTTPLLNAANCPISQVATIPLGNVTFVAGRAPLAAGVAVPAAAFSGVAPNYSAYGDVRVQFVCSAANCGVAVTGCATDGFTIRPQSFTITSSANADATGLLVAAVPVVKTGASFTLTANSATAGYNGIPNVDITKAEWLSPPVGGRAAPGVGTISGSPVPAVLSFATAATLSTGNSASGNFTYDEVGYFRFQSGGVYDGAYAAPSGDVAQGDCTNDYSNVLVGGKYGCKVANQAATSYFGRFVPDHFAMSGGSLVNRSDVCPLGTNCPSTFTYIGELLNAVFTLTAQNLGNATTQNYSGTFAKLIPTSAVTCTTLAGVTTCAPLGLGVVDTNAPRTAFNPSAPCAAHPCFTPSVATSGSFTGGVATNITVPLTVYRGAAGVGPYTALNVGVAPVGGAGSPGDSDGVLLAGYNLNANVLAGANDHTLVGATIARYGQMKLSNANGSELLPLPIAVTAQYFDGTSATCCYVTNTLDSVTNFAATNVVFGTYHGILSAAIYPNSGATSVTPASVVFPNGTSSFILAKPGAGNTGSVDLTTNAPTYLPNPTNPAARATFGVYKGANEFIYLRENY